MADKSMIENRNMIPVSTRIKNACKEQKEKKHVSNQQISDGILEMFDIDIPTGTVANFFAERSKAASVYTTGYICAYLGVSLDEQFGIKTSHPVESSTEIAVLQERIIAKDSEIILRERMIAELKKGIKNRRPVIRICLAAVVVMAIVLMAYIAMDFSAPDAGFFQPGSGFSIVGYVTIAIVGVLVISAIAVFIVTELNKRKDLKK